MPPSQTLGQAGRVMKVFPSGDVRVAVNGRVWTFNPQAMVTVPDENPPEMPGTESGRHRGSCCS